MGYFSNLAQEHLESDEDRSYPSPEEQLLCRVEELKDKLEELTESGAPYDGWEYLTDDDVRYAIPSYFTMIGDAERAIALALQELKEEYGIETIESDCRQEEGWEVDAEQITLFETIRFLPLQAA